MEDKYIVYRDKEKSLIILVLEGSLLTFCIAVLINPHIMGITERYTPGVWRIISGMFGLAVLSIFIIRLRLLIRSSAYLILDSEGIEDKEFDKRIMWKNVKIIEGEFTKYGWLINIFYKKDVEEEKHSIVLLDVKGDAERIVRIVKAYWKKYS